MASGIYANNAYLRGSEHDEVVDHVHALTVGSCGMYRLISAPRMLTCRPDGRADYQIVYVAAGRAHVSKRGSERTVPSGAMVSFVPGEEQRYWYLRQDEPDVRWVHFSGTQAGHLLAQAGFMDDADGILQAGEDPAYLAVFDTMIQELRLQREGFAQIAQASLRMLLTYVRRFRKEMVKPADHRMTSLIEGAVRFLNEHYADPVSIRAYAAEQFVSEAWFIRTFSNTMGTSPLRYLRSIRMDKARVLLETTTYPVKEIALLVGYRSPLYFSRVFRASNGCPPSQFRCKHQPGTRCN